MNYLVVLCCACSPLIFTNAKAHNLTSPPLLMMPTEVYDSRPYKCSFGCRMNDDTSSCEPICEPPCKNGECTAPGVCKCSPGFRESLDRNVCAPSKPVCKVDCVTFRCIENAKCMCLNRSNSYTPASSECECPQNYKKTTSDGIPTCTPICEPLCINGECIEPGKCKCFSGYSNQTGNVCNPLCKDECVNSTCVRDGECQCIAGYEKHKLDPSKCKPSCWTCTDDECIKPNVCRCPAGSTKLYVEPRTDMMRWMNTTTIHLAFCIPLSSNYHNTTETTPVLATLAGSTSVLASLAGSTSVTSIVILLLLAVLVIGILAISMSHLRNRRTACRVDRCGSVNQHFSEQGDQRVELRSIDSEEP